jgi:hypothetical protein
VRPDVWPSAYTTDLLELINVLAMVTELEVVQDELLEQVMREERITVSEMNRAGVLPVPDAAREPLPKLRRNNTDQTTRLPF